MDVINIDVDVPFALYANCSVIYDGRAYSTLKDGNYLIISKSDGAFLIHGADLCMPRNYQGANSKLMVDGQSLICMNKSEKIIVNINHIIHYNMLHEWSSSKIEISRTEDELVQDIYNNWHDYFDDEFTAIYREYKTQFGLVDILGETIDKRYYVVEVKRKKATLSDCTQLRRYVDCFDTAYGYLATPSIGKNALKFLGEMGFTWLHVDFK